MNIRESISTYFRRHDIKRADKLERKGIAKRAKAEVLKASANIDPEVTARLQVANPTKRVEIKSALVREVVSRQNVAPYFERGGTVYLAKSGDIFGNRRENVRLARLLQFGSVTP